MSKLVFYTGFQHTLVYQVAIVYSEIFNFVNVSIVKFAFLLGFKLT